MDLNKVVMMICFCFSFRHWYELFFIVQPDVWIRRILKSAVEVIPLISPNQKLLGRKMPGKRVNSQEKY